MILWWIGAAVLFWATNSLIWGIRGGQFLDDGED